MHIIGIEGRYGSGKTTTAVVKAQQWALMTGAKLFANFPLRGAYLFSHFSDWYRVADAHGSIIIFDEAVKNYDSRKWASSGQIEQTHVMNYVRKMNSLMIFILPDYNDLESRIRNKTDILIYCKRAKGGGIKNYVFDQSIRNKGEDRGKLINQWYLPLSSLKKIWDLNLFNTHSMIHSFPTPNSKDSDKFFKELDRRHLIALERNYGSTYAEIDTLDKEELIIGG
jgi:hypothetical protein